MDLTPTPFWRQFDDASSPWVCETEGEYDALRSRLFFSLVSRANVDGNIELDWLFNPLEEFMYGLESARLRFLLNNQHQWGNEDDETWELFTAKEDVKLSIEELIAYNSLEWTVDDDLPVLHFVDFKEARQLWENRQNTKLALSGSGSAGLSSDELDALNRMPYPEYLASEVWRRRRLRHLKFAKDRCQVCNSSKSLNVHHRSYERRGYESAADLIVLCGDCHKLFHEHGRIKR